MVFTITIYSRARFVVKFGVTKWLKVTSEILIFFLVMECLNNLVHVINKLDIKNKKQLTLLLIAVIEEL